MPAVQTGDVETYYERRGDGPPIVFVHGAIMDHRQWEPQLDALGDEYTTIAYDVRGHGLTGGSSRGVYSIDLLADDLSAFLDALGLESPVICGHSMGGCIAQVFAARSSGRVAGLVLADTFGPDILGVGEWLQRSVLMRATVPPVRLVGYERVERAMVWLQERVQGSEVSGDYGRIESLRETGPKMETAEFAKVIRALARFDEAVVDLVSITAPTLVLYGEHDAGFVRRHADRFGTVVPDATVRAVPDAGHASNVDNPAFFSDALQAFLAERVWPDDHGVSVAALTAAAPVPVAAGQREGARRERTGRVREECPMHGVVPSPGRSDRMVGNCPAGRVEPSFVRELWSSAPDGSYYAMNYLQRATTISRDIKQGGGAVWRPATA